MVKIAIKEDCIDLYLLERVSEETAIKLGFQIIEVPQSMASKSLEDCKLSDFDNKNGKFEFNRERYEERLLKEKELALLPSFKEEAKRLSEDIVQIYCGAIFPDVEQRLARFREVHNKMREIEGKQPRKYLGVEEDV